METMGTYLGLVYELFNHKFEVFGFAFSFWQVLIWSTVASIVLAFLRGVFGD